MEQQRTPETKESKLDRPLTLVVVTAVSYVVAATIAMNPGHADTSSQAATAPTPYSDDHARITNEEPQPPTF